MIQLTIHGFDDEFERRLRFVARERQISVKKAALLLMRTGAGLETDEGRPNVVGDSLDHLMGIWSEDEAAEFREATKALAWIHLETEDEG